MLYAPQVLRKLEHGCSATYPCTIDEMAKLEQVQWFATRLVDGLQGFSQELPGMFITVSWSMQVDSSVRGQFDKDSSGRFGPELQWNFPR